MNVQKRVSDSYTEQVHILTPNTMNGNNHLFGGCLMEWIDVVAVVTARRHCGKNVITAAVDRLEFKGSANINNLVVLCGKIVYAGKTSMQVCVKSYVEDYDGSRVLINQAYVTLVAIDDDEKPCRVPELICLNEEEHIEYEAARVRAEEYRRKRMG